MFGKIRIWPIRAKTPLSVARRTIRAVCSIFPPTKLNNEAKTTPVRPRCATLHFYVVFI